MEFSAKAMTRLRPRKHPKTASLWETVSVVAALFFGIPYPSLDGA